MTECGVDGNAIVPSTAARYCIGEAYLDRVPPEDVSFIILSLFEVYREAKLTKSGEIVGEHAELLAGFNIRAAISSLAKTFYDSLGWIPFHDHRYIQRKHKMFVSDYLLAFDNMSPRKNIQRAISTELLHHLACAVSLTVLKVQVDHAIHLIIVTYFFSMRSCKLTKTTSPGRTKMINLRGVCFYNSDHTEVSHKYPYLIQKSTYVWVLFEDKKNGMKFYSRLKKKTENHLLCPVL